VNLRFVISFICLFLLSVYSFSSTYYVDAVGGNDSNDGKSILTAWKNLSKVNAATFQPGDTILLKCGSVWNSTRLYPLGSGTSSKPIRVSSYGKGNLPLINSSGANLSSIRLSNQEYWEIENIEMTNHHPTDSVSTRYGVYITGNNMGAVNHIILRNLVIHDVNADPSVKTCGGIFFEIPSGGTSPAWFDSLIIDGCNIYDVSPVGIANNSMWSTRTLTTNTNWYPSTNVIIRNNTISRTVRNGAIIRVSKNALVEHNIFQECAKDSSGNAVFTFNCDSTIIQYSEAFDTRYNAGDEDAAGFDADYRCKSTIIQYNYSHNNEYGAVVVVSDGTGATTFNDGTIIRYNVFKDNLNHIIRTSGNITNTSIYNNTIYSSSSLSSIKIIWHKSWGGYSDSTSYYNNIFEILTPGSSYSFGSSTNNIFNYNLFYGVHPSSEPADPNKLTSDPKFVDPSSVGNGWISAAGYRLQTSSPAINSGMTISGHPNQDFLGNPVPIGMAVDRGAFERGNLFTLTVTSNHGVVEKNPDLSLYDSATIVQLTAIPNSGYHFTNWSGDAAGMDNPISIMMTANKSVNAWFESDSLTITATTGSHGTISPLGAVKVYHGSNIRFGFFPDLGYHTDSVIINGLKVDSTEGYTFVNVLSDCSIRVVYKINEYTLTINAMNGQVLKNPDQLIYDYGTVVRLTAVPTAGYHFLYWEDSLSGNNNPDSVTMYNNKTITAIFAKDSLSIDVNKGWNMISVPVVPVDYRKIVLFPTAVSDAFYYKAGYIKEDTLMHGKGYWLKFGVNQNIKMPGEPISVDSVVVQAGWNMIGSITKTVSTSSVGKSDGLMILSSFYKYNNGYILSDSIYPGAAYWVKVNQDGKLILNSSVKKEVNKNNPRTITNHSSNK
jgi:hypothetical protein